MSKQRPLWTSHRSRNHGALTHLVLEGLTLVLSVGEGFYLLTCEGLTLYGVSLFTRDLMIAKRQALSLVHAVLSDFIAERPYLKGALAVCADELRRIGFQVEVSP